MSELKTSPLHARHEALGASFTPFGPWNMPLKYQNELDEHRAVRNASGLFDLSHMGEVRVCGPQAGEFLDYALLSTMSPLAVGKAKYSMLLNEDAGILDDLISYRLGEQEFLVVPNAGNTAVVVEELQKRAEGFDVEVSDESGDTALVAVQGPTSEDIVASLIEDADDKQFLRDMKYYSAAPLEVAGIRALVARTGYTGEDGFELYVTNADAEKLWDTLLECADKHEGGLIPCGLASRDSLRLEAGMPLYGNELSADLCPHDVGLGVLRGKKECDFVGREALDRRKEEAHRKLVGIKGLGRRAARKDAQLFLEEGGEAIGVVTSGLPSPTLGYPVALAFVDKEHAETGTKLKVDIRGRMYDVEIVDTPFYSKKR